MSELNSRCHSRRCGDGRSDASATRAPALSSTCCAALAPMAVATRGTDTAAVAAGPPCEPPPASVGLSEARTGGNDARRAAKMFTTPGQALAAAWKAGASPMCGASASVILRTCCCDAASLAEGHVASSAPMTVS